MLFLPNMPNLQYTIPAGDETPETKQRLWVSGFTAQSYQRKMNKISAGYATKSYGGLIGIDTDLENGTTLGIALSKFDTNIKFQGKKAGDISKVNSTMLSLYNIFPIRDHAFIQSIASYGENLINSSIKRLISKKTYSKAYAKYRSKAFNATILLGYNIENNNENSFTITPVIGAKCFYYIDNGYNEYGILSRNMSIAKKNGYSIDGILGARLTFSTTQPAGINFTPEVHAFINQDLSKKIGHVKAKLSGSTTEISTLGKTDHIHKTIVNLGGSINIGRNNIVNATLGYDARLMKGFVSHQGALKLTVRF